MKTNPRHAEHLQFARVSMGVGYDDELKRRLWG